MNNFCSAKDSVKKMKRQSHQTGKSCLQDKSDKEVVSRVYKELSKANNKPNQFNNWAKDLSRHFRKENVQMANKQLSIICHHGNAN